MPPSVNLRVMSFNLRFAGQQGPHAWSERRPVVAELLRRERPHLLGTQEGLPGQLRDVLDDLPDAYAMVARGREPDGGGEAMAVLWDSSRLQEVGHGHYWLSDEPDAAGSRTWPGEFPRMVTWVRLADLVTGDELYAVNTHLEVTDAGTRLRSAALIADRLAALEPGIPVILTADANEPARGAVHARLLNAGLVDAWEAARHRGPAYGTFHDWREPEPDGDRIDWVLVSPTVVVRDAAVVTYRRARAWPSDHLPVRVDLDLDRAGRQR